MYWSLSSIFVFLSVLTFTFPKMGEASGAQDTHEFHHHVIWLRVASIGEFLVGVAWTNIWYLIFHSFLIKRGKLEKQINHLSICIGSFQICRALLSCTLKKVNKANTFFASIYFCKIPVWHNASAYELKHFCFLLCSMWAWEFIMIHILKLKLTCTRETRIRQKCPEVSDWMASSRDFL